MPLVLILTGSGWQVDALIPPSSGGGVLPESILGAGDTAITQSLHANRPLIVNQAGATTGTFAAKATSGAVAGASFFLLNTGAGTWTAQGTITAPTGFKLTATAGERFTADYDSVDDAWYSSTPSASGASPLVAVYQGRDVTIPLDTVANNIVVTQTIPAGLLGPNGWMEYMVHVSRAASGVAACKVASFFGGVLVDDQHSMALANLSYQLKRSIYNDGVANAQYFWTRFAVEPQGDQGDNVAFGTTAVNTANAADFTIRTTNTSVETQVLKVKKWVLRCYYGA